MVKENYLRKEDQKKFIFPKKSRSKECTRLTPAANLKAVFHLKKMKNLCVCILKITNYLLFFYGKTLI